MSSRQQRFAIISMPRTGSHLLGSLLHSHNQIFVHGELFHPHKIGLSTSRRYNFRPLQDALGQNMIIFRNSDPIGFLNLAMQVDVPAVGFKLFINHSKIILDYIIDCEDYTLIILDRDNRLAMYASELAAKRTNVWFSAEQTPMSEIDFSEQQFLYKLSFIESHYAALRERVAGRRNVIRIEYNQIVMETLRYEILDMLCVDSSINLTSPLVKQNPGDVLSRFTNPDLVTRALEKIGKPQWAFFG